MAPEAKMHTHKSYATAQLYECYEGEHNSLWERYACYVIFFNSSNKSIFGTRCEEHHLWEQEHEEELFEQIIFPLQHSIVRL